MSRPHSELFSGDQMTECKEVFSLFDKQGKGTIATEDIVAVIRSLGENPTEVELQQIMGEVGVTENSELKFSQFLNVLLKVMENGTKDTEEELRLAFKAFDYNGDGYINADTLRYIMTALGDKWSEEEADEIIKEIDVDENGQLNYEEFIAMVKNND